MIENEPKQDFSKFGDNGQTFFPDSGDALGIIQGAIGPEDVGPEAIHPRAFDRLGIQNDGITETGIKE